MLLTALVVPPLGALKVAVTLQPAPHVAVNVELQLAGGGGGGAEHEPETTLSVPALQVTVAEPVFGPLDETEVLFPLFSAGTEPEQATAPLDHPIEAAVQFAGGGGGGAVQVLPETVTVPLLQETFALPELVPDAEIVVPAPLARNGEVPVQLIPLTLQPTLFEAQLAGGGGGGAVQVLPETVTVPLLQETFALPVLIPVAEIEVPAPLAMNGDVPVQLFPPTLQPTLLEAQLDGGGGGGAEQVLLVRLSVPLLHATFAVPVLMPVAVTDAPEPLANKGDVPEHALPPLVHPKPCDAQLAGGGGGGTEQVLLDTLNVPLVQDTVAEPLLTPVAVTEVLEPLTSSGDDPAHVLPPLLHPMPCAAQLAGGGTLQVRPETVSPPLLHETLAVPEFAPVDEMVWLSPCSRAGMLPVHPTPDTFQPTLLAVQLAGGGGAQPSQGRALSQIWPSGQLTPGLTSTEAEPPVAFGLPGLTWPAWPKASPVNSSADTAIWPSQALAPNQRVL